MQYFMILNTALHNIRLVKKLMIYNHAVKNNENECITLNMQNLLESVAGTQNIWILY
jgi:hypothetical protein